MSSFGGKDRNLRGAVGRPEQALTASGVDHRITLTYNLLLHGDTSRPDGDDGTVAELADLLREHFSTPVPRYYGGPAGGAAAVGDATRRRN